MNKKTTYLKNVVKTLESYDKLVRINDYGTIENASVGENIELTLLFIYHNVLDTCFH
jgi:hypothetical protein